MYKLAALLGLFWAARFGGAATLQQLSLDQMTETATTIVRARVTGSAASFTGKTIYTHYKLQILETLKGSASSEVMIPGGVAGGYRQSFPGMPVLSAGGEYVLFLWKSSTGITHLLGLNQGLFDVRHLSDGALQVSRDAIGENIFDASGRPVKDPAVQMGWSAMKSRVAAVVGSSASGTAAGK